MFDLAKSFVSFSLKREIVAPTSIAVLDPPETSYTYVKNDMHKPSGHFSLDTMNNAPNRFYLGGRPNLRLFFTRKMHYKEVNVIPESEIPNLILALICGSTTVHTATVTANYSWQQQREEVKKRKGGDHEKIIISCCSNNDVPTCDRGGGGGQQNRARA